MLVPALLFPAFLFLTAALPALSWGETAQPDAPSPRPFSLPLPGGAIYQPKGLVGVFAGGTVRDLQDDASLFQWQGEVTYAYMPWLSAGAGFRIKAGEPSDSVQKVENRYFVLMRFHKAWRHVDVFAGPQMGFDNLNLTAPFEDNADTTLPDGNLLTKAFQANGVGLGLEFGVGYKPFPWGGLTLGHRFEYSLANLSATRQDASRTFNFRAFPGISLDMLHFFPIFGRSVHGFYVFTELQSGYLFVVQHRRRVETAWIAGFSMGF